jgi:hypothetical protein
MFRCPNHGAHFTPIIPLKNKIVGSAVSDNGWGVSVSFETFKNLKGIIGSKDGCRDLKWTERSTRFGPDRDYGPNRTGPWTVPYLALVRFNGGPVLLSPENGPCRLIDRTRPNRVPCGTVTDVKRVREVAASF